MAGDPVRELLTWVSNAVDHAAEITRAAMRHLDTRTAEPGGYTTGEYPPQISLTKLARLLYKERRLRDTYDLGNHFGEAAWDILLDLYASQRVSVSSLCIAACVPPTTALRWIKLMSDQGILVRLNDPDDGRRIYVELAPEMRDKLTSYLRRVGEVRHQG
jgi:DNA-binding MarR family transcriptional regulator